VKVTTDDSRGLLLAGVRARQDEIARAVFGRIHAIGEGAEADLEYRDGLRHAAEAAVDYTIDALEAPAGATCPVPDTVHSQARLAARRGVPLETVLRRYLAGHAMLGDFIAEEAERIELPAGVLRWVLRTQAAATDQVVADISGSYLREAASVQPRSTRQRRVEVVARLLNGELADPTGLDYDLDGWHLAMALRGPEGQAALDAISSTMDARKLIVPAADDTTWMWFGTRHRLEPSAVHHVASRSLAKGTWVGIGESAGGLAGWRLSHKQAAAALAVSMRRSEISTRYADVALLASVIGDDLLKASLRQLYLVPLDDGPGGVLRDTISAYLAARRNVTSAAAALSVDRRTVANRLRAAEERIGTSLDRCLGQLEIALQLDQLDHLSSN
jgi:hypothetical protein